MAVRSRLVALVLTGSVTVALGACSGGTPRSLPHPSKAFCDAAVKYDTAIQKMSKKSEEDKARAQVPLVEQMAQHAPNDIKTETRTFLDALRRRADGDTSVVDDEHVAKAVDDVNRRAGNGCGLYQSETGGGI